MFEEDIMSVLTNMGLFSSIGDMILVVKLGLDITATTAWVCNRKAGRLSKADKNSLNVFTILST